MGRKKRSFAIIGAGRFGSAVATSLVNMDQQVLVVDRNADKVDALAPIVTYAVRADVSVDGGLDGIGLHSCDVAIIAISGNFEASVLATSICKEKKIPQIICKAQNERHSRILRSVGATSVILPERDMGIRVANKLVNNKLFEFIELSKDYYIAEINVPKTWIGKSLAELDIRKNYGVSIIGINNADFVSINPTPEDAFRSGDHIFVLGTNEAIEVIRMINEEIAAHTDRSHIE